MHEITAFGTIVLVVGAAFVLAVLASKLTSYVPVPAPAIFLLAAAVASDVFPISATSSRSETVERVGVVALILILFDGGMHVGWRRFRASVVPIGVLGVVGTFATALIIAVAAHAALRLQLDDGRDRRRGARPTDPAVMFSVLGRREIARAQRDDSRGRVGRERPVGIALMIGMIDIATHGGDVTIWVVGDFALRWPWACCGLAWAPGCCCRSCAPRCRTRGCTRCARSRSAGAHLRGATVAHGSGFLAVFVAGLLIGDARAPYKAEIEQFHSALASWPRSRCSSRSGSPSTSPTSSRAPTGRRRSCSPSCWR